MLVDCLSSVLTVAAVSLCVAVSQPRTQRSKRALEARAPKLVEGPRRCLVLKGSKTSNVVLSLLRSFHILQQPHSTHLHHPHAIHPFDDSSSLEFLASKADASLFVLGSHSKKRPDNVVIGRTFDYQVLDMVEYAVKAETYKGIEAFEGVRKATVRYGSKPCIVFQGEWEQPSSGGGGEEGGGGGDDWAVQRSLWLDLFKGETLPAINLSAVDRVIVLTAQQPSTIRFRHYGIRMRHSAASALPVVELDEVGPRVDLSFRRRQPAPPDLAKASMQQPKRTAERAKERKNLEVNSMGERVGRVHMQRQNLSNVAIARLKGLKRKRGAAQEDEGEAEDAATAKDGAAGEGMDRGGAGGEGRSLRKSVSGPGGFGPNRHEEQTRDGGLSAEKGKRLKR